MTMARCQKLIFHRKINLHLLSNYLVDGWLSSSDDFCGEKCKYDARNSRADGGSGGGAGGGDDDDVDDDDDGGADANSDIRLHKSSMNDLYMMSITFKYLLPL